MSRRLEGMAALVFGAGQAPGDNDGNGRAIARMFADHGAKVGCADIDLDRATETAALIGDTALPIRCNVTNLEDCQAAVRAVIEKWGALDVVVNNVGIGSMKDRGPPQKIVDEVYNRIMEVNIRGPLNGIAAAVPEMAARGGGSIINISSLASVSGNRMIAYEMSKAAVNRLTASTALTNAEHRIRINAIAPGLMDTPTAIQGYAAATGQTLEEVRAIRSSNVPMGWAGTAEDTAFAALFLASRESAFITGIVLPVDGGSSARVG